MLTLTDNAVTAIRALTSQPDFPDETGLRIVSHGEDIPSFQLALVANPAEGDQVIETDGARVFLEQHAAEALADKALDAEVDDQGGVAFSVSVQADAR